VYGLCVGGVSLAGNLRRGDVWRHMPRGRTRMQLALHIGAGACTHRRIEADTACVAHAVLHSSCCAHGRIWPHTPRYGAIRQDSMHFLRRRAHDMQHAICARLRRTLLQCGMQRTVPYMRT
jgi:hypothetical protein